MSVKFYKFDDWYIQDRMEFDFDKRVYIDEDDKPITGILEDFYYFDHGDPRNHVYVENGKRVYNEKEKEIMKKFRE